MLYIKHILKRITSPSIFCNIRFYSVCSVDPKISHKRLKNDSNSLNITVDTSSYYFEDGLRKVYPFYLQFSAFCKERWINRKIVDAYSEEFSHFPKEEGEYRIKKGFVKINDKVVGLDYVLKYHDVLTSCIHQHELPVLACSIEILFEDDNFLVVNKPPSIPIHPCGPYSKNSILSILASEYKKSDLYIAYRLDRLSSGVLVFAKSSKKIKEFHAELNLPGINKEYVCRVEGNFPEDTIICSVPIKNFYHIIGLSLVHAGGKVAVTEFKKLSYNGKSSVVLCKPRTGRTHQIRVHLQYLGHPIINDPVYNRSVFESVKAKNGIIEKPISQLIEDLLGEHYSKWSFEKLHKDNNIIKVKDYLSYGIFKEYYMNKEMPNNYKKDNSKIIYDEDCYFCRNIDYSEQSALGIFLHACKYETKNWSFEAPMPFWASENWNIA